MCVFPFFLDENIYESEIARLLLNMVKNMNIVFDITNR